MNWLDPRQVEDWIKLWTTNVNVAERFDNINWATRQFVRALIPPTVEAETDFWRVVQVARLLVAAMDGRKP